MLEDALTLEATAFGLLAATDDKREGTRAFLDKRPRSSRARERGSGATRSASPCATFATSHTSSSTPPADGFVRHRRQRPGKDESAGGDLLLADPAVGARCARSGSRSFRRGWISHRAPPSRRTRGHEIWRRLRARGQAQTRARRRRHSRTHEPRTRRASLGDVFSRRRRRWSSGAPSVRRRFLDIVLALTARGYTSTRFSGTARPWRDGTPRSAMPSRVGGDHRRERCRVGAARSPNTARCSR